MSGGCVCSSATPHRVAVLRASAGACDDHRLAGAHAGQHLAAVADGCRPGARRGARPCRRRTTNTMSCSPSLRSAAAGTSTRGAARRAGGGRWPRPRGRTRARPCPARCAGRSASSAMRTLTVALARSAVGMIAITSAGIFQSGIGVEHRLDRHLRLHAADVGLVDVDLDLERIHVDDGADAGAGEAAAGATSARHLARLRGLGDDHAGERRAHDGVVDADARRCAGRRWRPGRCAARSCRLRAQRVALGDAPAS